MSPEKMPFGQSIAKRVAPIVAVLALSVVCPSSEVESVPLQSCDTPGAQDFEAVDTLLGAPTDPYVQERSISGWDEQAANDFTGYHVERAIVDIQANVAESLDLTTHDYLAYSRNLKNDTYNKEGRQLPYSKYFEQANEFADLFGIKLVVADRDFPVGFGVRPPTEAELETNETKGNLLRLIENLGLLPEELVKFAGLNQIVLAYINEQIDDEGNAFIVGGYASSDVPGTYVVNVKGYLSRKVFAHELYHLVDVAQCGWLGIVRDPLFRTLNTGKIYKDEGVDPKKVYVKEDITAFYNTYSSAMEAARDNNDIKAYCNYMEQAGRISESAQTTTRYGLTNPAEDKAEIFSEMLDTRLQEGGDFIDNRNRTIKEKVSFC